MHKSIPVGSKHEHGQTIILVAIAMIALLAMAALAIDVVTLYVARSEAQRAANAAALAGAKMFAASGFTSQGTNTTISSGDVCNAAKSAALTVAAQNLVAGQPAVAIVVPPCPGGSSLLNPHITISVTRTGLPTFFARIWGKTSNSISATATAEAYNPSYDSPELVHPAIRVSAKPWLIPNCNPGVAPPCTAAASYFFDPANNYALKNQTPPYLGGNFTFRQRNSMTPVSPAGPYYVIGSLPQATVCPSPSAQPPNSCSQLGSSPIYDDIACSEASQANQLSCGDTVSVDPNTGQPAMITSTIGGTQCLIHTNTTGAPGVPSEQDEFTEPNGANTPPVMITGGTENPNPNLQTIQNISRSDSIVTVPVYDGQTDLCNGSGTCQTNVMVVGFLQLGIRYITNTGRIHAVVINAAGCNPTPSGGTVSGGGVSPIPVRLITPP